MVKMVIYDCDGVIFDSKKANLEYYNYILKHFGYPPVNENDKEKLLIIHTYSNDNVILNLFEDKDIAKKAIEFSKSVDYSQFYKYMTMEPEFFETCNLLKSNGIKVAIATNRSKTFPHLFKYFNLDKVIDDYATVSIVKNPKPAPDMLLYLLNRNNLKPFEALYIGDAEIDYIASKEAKIPFIGYKKSFNNCPKINKHLEILKHLQNR